MARWAHWISLGLCQLLFTDQPEDSAQAFVAHNVGLTHGYLLVSDLVLQNPFPGAYFDMSIDEFEHGYTLLAQGQIFRGGFDQVLDAVVAQGEVGP